MFEIIEPAYYGKPTLVEVDKTNSELVETIPIGEKDILILRTTESKLRTDLTQEAIAQGISPDNAEALANQVRWFIQIPSTMPEGKFCFGLVERKTREGPVNCYLNPKIITKLVGNFDSFPEEVKIFTIRQVIIETWRHERQHLIQTIRPIDLLNSEAYGEKQLLEAEKILKITAGALAGSLALSFIDSPVALVATGSGIVIGCIGSYLIVKKAVINAYYKNPLEEDARRHSKYDTYPDKPDLFTIELEKVDNY